MSQILDPDLESRLLGFFDPATRLRLRDELRAEETDGTTLTSVDGLGEHIIRALKLIHLVARSNPAPACVPDLLRYYSALRRTLPEKAKAGHSREAAQAMETILGAINNCYGSLGDLIHEVDKPALIPPDGVAPVTHRALKKTVRAFKLPLTSRPGNTGHPRVAIAIPNGPLLAASCIAVASRYIAAPINATVGVQQFRADVDQVKADCVLTTPDLAEKLEMTPAWADEQGLQIILVSLEYDGSLKLTQPSGDPVQLHGDCTPPNKASDTCILLFTSGTSGTKKIVPLTLHLVVTGAILVIDSWGLSSSDICLNMMPLFHIGGLLRNVFAPVLSGGSTICCPAFDPSLFWIAVDQLHPTWYYASPTMHNLILSSAPADSATNSCFRLICNAAGGLLPSLALELQTVFRCTVLPSYGMTECMPISTPPLSYRLEREGTSGIATGPDLAVLNYQDVVARPHTIGRICVRGDPVFGGYLRNDGSIDKSAFTADGWFDTGDLGYLDEDGFLYVTGRSKEVINRGGEIISPFEVENAIVGAAREANSPIAGRVSEALAFSVPHDVLQEVVGVVLVLSPGSTRTDLRVLHETLKSSLQQAKWPSLIVYMDALPKKNNKVLRIQLADRLSLPTLTHHTPYHDCHWEATCPSEHAPLRSKIPRRICSYDKELTERVLRTMLPHERELDIFIRTSQKQGGLEAIVAPKNNDFGRDLPQAHANLEAAITPNMASRIDNYLIPQRLHWLSHPLPRRALNHAEIDEHALDKMLSALALKDVQHLMSTIEGRVIVKFSEVLQCDPQHVQPSLDFFSLGGDSLKAGKLTAALRAEFGVSVPIGLVFSDGTPSSIARHIEDSLATDSSEDEDKESRLPGCEEVHSSTNFWLLIIQLVPMVVVYPFRRALQWTIFMVALSFTQSWSTSEWIFGRLFNLTLCILFAQLILRLTIPWLGIATKWILIGRYREGLYPMWGAYHTRWWLVQKTVDVCGPGAFAWTSYTRVMYYRLMGASIGRGVTMDKVSIGEWDLVEIGDGACLERCIVRPFGAERNSSMFLGKIKIGRNSTVAVSSIVAPGTCVPDDTCIGANSSSWELDDASEENRDLLSNRIPKPHWALTMFGTVPLWALSWIISLIPWFVGLTGLVVTAPSDSANPLYSILHWFAAGHRVGFHYLALVMRSALAPFFTFGFALAVKWILDRCFGELTAGPTKGRSQLTNWRMALMRRIFPVSRLHEMTEMMGSHYEGTSIAIRLLGGRVGQRVYWPGTGPSISDYHLIKVGNDVVFGSRSHMVTSDGTGSESIIIENNAMIADRVTLLPGVTVGTETTLGSGSLTKRNKSYEPGATYVGSKGGDAILLASSKRHGLPPSTATSRDTGLIWGGRDSPPGSSSSASSVTLEKETGNTFEESFSPFGRAFYLKKAPYHVLGLFTICFYSTFITVFTRFYWNVGSISSIQIADLVFRDSHTKLGHNSWYEPFVLFCISTVLISIITTMQAVAVLLFIIASKWVLIGRRQPGNYDWDKSPYCQRWQLLLSIERLRRSCYRGHGILGMLTGTHWIVLYFRALGAKIGKDCALFANGSPNLYFTEPDLLELGDRVVVDDASLVGHLNARGKFDLNKLHVGNRCVLRTGSRLLSGAMMMDDSCLLEHTLVMSGDIVEANQTMQGWPASVFRGNRTKTLGEGRTQGQ